MKGIVCSDFNFKGIADMKQSYAFKAKINNKIITASAAIAVFFMNNIVRAQAQEVTQHLKKVEKGLSAIKTDLDKVIPTVAALILLGLAIGYAARVIEKDTFIRWSIGVIIAGSALELAKLFFSPT